jgi:peptidyl-prolyl cis-trans isomerase C
MRCVVVHGVEIPESLIAQEAQNHPSLSAGAAREAAGHALATKALLLRRAQALGLTPEPERDEDGREETAEAALIRAVLDAEVEIAAPTEAECRRLYEAQRSRFSSPLLYEAAHILIAPEDETEGALDRARIAAEQTAQDLAREPGRFAELARARSACPSASVGGSLGQLGPGELVAEVETALLALGPGEIAPAPVRSRFGWHILKLERRLEGRLLPFEHVAASIRMNLEARAWTAAAARYVLELAREAEAKGVALAFDEDGAVADGSACLGDFLGDGTAAGRLVPWLRTADPALAERLDQVAGDGDPAQVVRAAAADFVGQADDEAWTRLISAAQGAGDPALAALAAILKSRLEPPKRSFTLIQRRGGR